jgi:Leucine-rich repeat (LRR) protein
LDQVPQAFCKFKSLKHLILNKNFIERISAQIFEALPNLEVINIKSNNLREFPPPLHANFFVDSNLREIKCTNNQITDVSRDIQQFTSLMKLKMNCNRMHKFPPINTLVHLRKLDLANNQISDVPGKAIQNLESLETLLLENNNISYLPSELGELRALQLLNLIGNRIDAIPYTIKNLTNLLHLYLDFNYFTVLPYWISKIPRLKTLSMNRNFLSCVPHYIGNLTTLESLNLANNRICWISSDIKLCINVGRLSLHSNLLTDLPAEITDFCFLNKVVDIHNNPLNMITDGKKNTEKLTVSERMVLHNGCEVLQSF